MHIFMALGELLRMSTVSGQRSLRKKQASTSTIRTSFEDVFAKSFMQDRSFMASTLPKIFSVGQVDGQATQQVDVDLCCRFSALGQGLYALRVSDMHRMKLDTRLRLTQCPQRPKYTAILRLP